MARTIGSQTVLPDLPHAPRMTQFPSVQIAKDTLPAFNAMGQGLAPSSPLPAPPQMPKSPTYNIPAGRGIGMQSAVMGGGFGQGIVPNAPRPAAPEVKFAEFSIPIDTSPSQNLGNYNLRSQNISPEAQYLRPSHTLEVYGSGPNFNVSHLNRVKPETHIPNTLIHSVTESFGNNPAHEVNRASMSRPPNPRALFHAPSINMTSLQAETKHIPLRQAPVLPKANIPHQKNLAGLIPVSSGLRFESQYVAPPVRASDLGGLAPNRHRQIGINAGRTFGAEGHLL
jgi:hypothetical protein